MYTRNRFSPKMQMTLSLLQELQRIILRDGYLTCKIVVDEEPEGDLATIRCAVYDRTTESEDGYDVAHTAWFHQDQSALQHHKTLKNLRRFVRQYYGKR